MPHILSDTIIWDNGKQVPVDEETGEPLPEIHQLKETHHIYVKGSINNDQAYFAWEYFKSARWVRSSVKEVIYPKRTSEEVKQDDEDYNYEGDDFICVYEVEVTYPSPEEQYEEDVYGWEYDSYDDY